MTLYLTENIDCVILFYVFYMQQFSFYLHLNHWPDYFESKCTNSTSLTI